MKIALISLNDLSRGYLPLGIASLAGGFRQKAHKVRLYHVAFSTKEEIVKQVNRFSPDVIGISFMTPHAKDAKVISRLLKKRGKVIIAGGPHATALPEDNLSESAIDFVVRGEGETTFIELCKAIGEARHIDSIPGIVCRDGSGRINFTPERPLIKDLDLLPRIPWDLLPVERYIKDFMANPSFGFKGMPIMASRGCPYNCIFCQPIHGKFCAITVLEM